MRLAARRTAARRGRRRPRPCGGGAADPGDARRDPVGERRGDGGHARRRARGRRPSCRGDLVDRGLRRSRDPPDPRGRPARRRRPLRRVEDRGGGALRSIRAARARHGHRAAEDVRRAGAPRRVRDPLRLDPRGTPDPDPRRRDEQVSASCRRGSRRGRRPLSRRPGLRGGPQRRRSAVRHRARGSRGARRPRRLRVTARPVPARPAELALRGLELARLSPLAEWHYRTAHKDSFVSIDKARTLLGWEPRLSNAETLCATYDWYLAHRDELGAAGTTHRVPWDQRALGVLRRLS